MVEPVHPSGPRLFGSQVELAELIEAVAEEGQGQCVVFDADGTLWRGDVGEDFLRYGIHRRLFEADYGLYESLLAQSPARAYAYCVEVMAGQREVELERQCADFFTQRYRGRIFSFVRPLLAKLAAAGCSPWICSASPRWTVAPGASALGISPQQVIGVTCPVVNGQLTGVVEQPVPVGPSKVTWLQRRKLLPALAVGNGDFDLDMLAFAKRALVVSPFDSSNLLVREGRSRGWPILRA